MNIAPGTTLQYLRLGNTKEGSVKFHGVLVHAFGHAATQVHVELSSRALQLAIVVESHARKGHHHESSGVRPCQGAKVEDGSRLVVILDDCSSGGCQSDDDGVRTIDVQCTDFWWYE
jgi:hypothetical protein